MSFHQPFSFPFPHQITWSCITLHFLQGSSEEEKELKIPQITDLANISVIWQESGISKNGVFTVSPLRSTKDVTSGLYNFPKQVFLKQDYLISKYSGFCKD